MYAGVLANIMGPDGLIVIVVLAVLLLFGGKQLPRLARGLGSASHEFKKGIDEEDPDSSQTGHVTSQPSDSKVD